MEFFHDFCNEFEVIDVVSRLAGVGSPCREVEILVRYSSAIRSALCKKTFMGLVLVTFNLRSFNCTKSGFLVKSTK
jgi:hypothetical protein